MGHISDVLAERWLKVMLDTPMWMGLMSADPAIAADPLAVEIDGAIYRRPQVSWGSQGRVLINQDPLKWSGLPLGTHIVAVAGFDAAYNGNMLFSELLSVPIFLPAGGGYSIDAGQFYVGILG